MYVLALDPRSYAALTQETPAAGLRIEGHYTYKRASIEDISLLLYCSVHDEPL